MASGRWPRLPALAICAAFASAGAGQAACPPGYPEGLPCPEDPWETVTLEHEDRIARLKRLANDSTAFEFHSGTIPAAEHGLADFPAEIPVLRVVADQSVFFNTASDVIRREAWPMLDTIAESLRREPPDVALFVAGHTDSRGDEDYNQALGLRRAQAVAEALARRGIYQAEIYRVSFGEAAPIADNATRAGQVRNRRVEFLFAARTVAIVSALERQEVQLCAEHYRDEMGRCGVPISFEAQKVSIPLEAQEQVIELERETAAIKADSTLTSVEIKRQRQAIEIRRERIPIVIDAVQIPIRLKGRTTAAAAE